VLLRSRLHFHVGCCRNIQFQQAAMWRHLTLNFILHSKWFVTLNPEYAIKDSWRSIRSSNVYKEYNQASLILFPVCLVPPRVSWLLAKNLPLNSPPSTISVSTFMTNEAQRFVSGWVLKHGKFPPLVYKPHIPSSHFCQGMQEDGCCVIEAGWYFSISQLTVQVFGETISLFFMRSETCES